MIIFKKKGLAAYIKEKQGEEIDIDEVVNVINLHHGTEEGTRYVRQWEKIKGKDAKGCANLNCKNHQSYDALVGAHVKIEGSDDGQWYITPLCHECNSDDFNEPMPVYKEDLELYTDVKDVKL